MCTAYCELTFLVKKKKSRKCGLWCRLSPKKKILGTCLLTHLVLSRVINKNMAKVFLLACGVYGDPELQMTPCAENCSARDPTPRTLPRVPRLSPFSAALLRFVWSWSSSGPKLISLTIPYLERGGGRIYHEYDY